MAWGVQEGIRQPQANRLAGWPPLMAVSGVACTQGIEGLGMVDPGDSLGTPCHGHPLPYAHARLLYFPSRDDVGVSGFLYYRGIWHGVSNGVVR
jgi:hypothetical protein